MTVDNHAGQPVRRPDLRDLDDVRRRRHRLHLRGVLQRLRRVASPPRCWSAATARCAATPSACRPRRAGATRTRTRSRSPHPTARCTSSTPTSTTSCTGADNRNQVLLARSTDGGASFSAPVKVGDYYDLPDCDTYQGAGADPLPRLRAGEGRPATTRCSAPSTTRSARSTRPTPNRVVVTFGSYINRNSNETRGCTPDRLRRRRHQHSTPGSRTAAATTTSSTASPTNRGASFSGTTIDPRQLPVVTDQPGAGQHRPVLAGRQRSPRTGTLVVSYYDRSYGDDNTHRLLRHHRVRLARPGHASPTSGPRRRRCRRRPSSPGSSTATTPAWRSPGHGLPDLVGHPHRRTSSSARAPDPPTALHRLGAQRAVRQ